MGEVSIPSESTLARFRAFYGNAPVDEALRRVRRDPRARSYCAVLYEAVIGQDSEGERQSRAFPKLRVGNGWVDDSQVVFDKA